MKSFLLATALTLVSTAAFALDTGKPAPDFKTTDIAGKEQSLSKYKGKTVVLEWNNPECPFVRKQYDTKNMQKLQHEATAQGVVWLTVNSGAEGKQGSMTPAQAKEKLADDGAHPTAYILDSKGTIGKLYGAKTTPHMFVVDKAGNLAYQGAIDDDSTADHEAVKTAKNYVRAALASLKAGKPVEVAETKAYGCSVKY